MGSPAGRLVARSREQAGPIPSALSFYSISNRVRLVRVGLVFRQVFLGREILSRRRSQVTRNGLTEKAQKGFRVVGRELAHAFRSTDVDPILGHRAHRAPTRRKREAGQWAKCNRRMNAKESKGSTYWLLLPDVYWGRDAPVAWSKRTGTVERRANPKHRRKEERR